MRAEDQAGISPEGNDHNGYWYVVHCKPLKEAFAATVLRDNMGLVTYLPQVTRKSSGGEGKRGNGGNGAEARPVVFFPGYLFVQANLREVKLSSINSAPGVLRLLQLGGEARPLPGEFVEALRKRIDSLNAEGGFSKYNFQPGDPVWLRSGPLRGLQAVFVGPMPAKARVKVLLEFLGRLNEVQVDVDVLEPTQPNPTPRGLRERTTRGRGRRIGITGVDEEGSRQGAEGRRIGIRGG